MDQWTSLARNVYPLLTNPFLDLLFLFAVLCAIAMCVTICETFRSLDTYRARCVLVLASCIFMTLLIGVITAYKWPVDLILASPFAYVLCSGCFVLFPLTLSFFMRPEYVSFKFMEGLSINLRWLMHLMIGMIIFFLNVLLLAVYLHSQNSTSTEATFGNAVRKAILLLENYFNLFVVVVPWLVLVVLIASRALVVVVEEVTLRPGSLMLYVVMWWLCSSIAVCTCYSYFPDVQQLTDARERLNDWNYFVSCHYILLVCVCVVLWLISAKIIKECPSQSSGFVVWFVALMCVVVFLAVVAITFTSPWTPPSSEDLSSSQTSLGCLRKCKCPLPTADVTSTTTFTTTIAATATIAVTETVFTGNTVAATETIATVTTIAATTVTTTITPTATATTTTTTVTATTTVPCSPLSSPPPAPPKTECAILDRDSADDIQPKQLHFLKYRHKGKIRDLRVIRDISLYCKGLSTMFGLYDVCVKDLQNCCQNILLEWRVRGSGDYPVSWNGLIKALREFGLNRVVADIETALQCVIP